MNQMRGTLFYCVEIEFFVMKLFLFVEGGGFGVLGFGGLLILLSKG